MASPGIWDPSAADFDMKRKASYSLFSGKAPQARPIPSPDAHPGSKGQQKLWELMQSYKANDTESIQKDIVSQLEYSLACTRFNFSEADAFRATAMAVRDRLIESLNDTTSWYAQEDVKRGYYLSAEYLLGRAFQNALASLDDRSRRIVEERWLKVNDDSSGGMTLHDLAAEIGRAHV